jgi:hypothetical protein
LLDCTPLEIARLPWEAWKLAPKDAPPGTVRIVRTVFSTTAPPPRFPSRSRSKIRILAILADASDLNHEPDQRSLQSLRSVAEIEFFHCQFLSSQKNCDQRTTQLKQRLAAAIADERGWDAIFFAGHSDEAATTGGKLELAPDVALSISEIEPHLTLARQRGLQLAVFNSCCGLHLAHALMTLGVAQVIVMRERIADHVAHVFLKQLCQHLSHYQDVYTAMSAASQYLVAEQISYPSGYLLPSLFCHPDPSVNLFQIEPPSWKRLYQQWRLTRWQAIALGLFSVASLMTPVRNLLADCRYWTQAVYRDVTHQLPPATSPPVTLVAIDQDSIERDRLDSYKVKPMDRAYLASLVDRLRPLHPSTVGIDYILDGVTTEDSILAMAMQKAGQQGTQFVIATRQNDAGQTIDLSPRLAGAHRVLPGNIDILDWQVMFPVQPQCQVDCPFAYQLAKAHVEAQEQQGTRSQPANHYTHNLALLPSLPSLGLAVVIDFSLPPQQVYQPIAAWDLLERPLNDPRLHQMQQQVVIIASGGYDQANDNYSLPLALRYQIDLNLVFRHLEQEPSGSKSLLYKD